ncbi:MAG TPA: zinc metallopeptidase [Saprospiraceae bacterium]|nr:zinc metallopeptidase [Saprospiraceae bacterium]HQW55190.1 zinc metallopeptidase [Saprospiraceae bacterium]
MSGGYMIYMVIGAVTSVIGMILNGVLKSKFAHYSQVGLHNRLSGREVAEKMLRDNGIMDVTVTSVPGHLTDHYNPQDKTVNLSPEVYEGRSVAAAAVASHECGHAVQHATAYPMLRFRSAIVPVVSFAAKTQQFLLLLALGVLGATGNQTILLLTIIAFFITTLFSLITLPVEFDASRRALVWLDASGMATGDEHAGARDALKWAAMTYVAAALSSLAMLLFLILRYTGRSSN